MVSPKELFFYYDAPQERLKASRLQRAESTRSAKSLTMGTDVCSDKAKLVNAAKSIAFAIVPPRFIVISETRRPETDSVRC